MESILTSIKKTLGIESDYTEFDSEITIHINSAMMNLNQVGIGPQTGFVITGTDETWKDFVGDRLDIEGIKTYIYLKVRLLFDPPQMGYLVEALHKQITELEWRLSVQVEEERRIQNGSEFSG